MSTSPGISFLAVTCFGLILLPISLMLLKFGLWPKQKGDAPHCRNCGYNLTGLTSNRCPECGTMLSEHTVVIGLRRRRPGFIIAGIVLLLPSLACVLVMATNVNWYRLRPTVWVISDARSSNAATARKAWRELNRRAKSRSLSPAHQRKLIEVCFREQGAATPGPCSDEFADYLGKCYVAGRLSDAQEKTFFQQGVSLSLQVRPRVLAGRDIPYTVWANARMPYEWFWRRVTGGDISIDDVPTGLSAGFRSSARGSLTGHGGRRVACYVPGEHTMMIAVHLAIYEGDSFDEEASTGCHEADIRVEAVFEVLEPGADDPIKVVDDPGLKDELMATITPNQFRTYSPLGSARVGVNGMLNLTTLPVGIAFEVFARIDGRVFPLDSVTRRAGQSRHGIGVHGMLPEPIGETFDLILRSSRDVAENSLDVFEFWQGELIFEDVPIKLGEKGG